MSFLKNNKKSNKRNRKTEKRKVSLEGSSPFDYQEDVKPKPETKTVIKVVREKSHSVRPIRNKFNGDNKSRTSIFKIVISLIIILILVGGGIYLYNRQKNVGVEAVMDMYNYDSIPQLATQQEHFKKITTEQVYNFNTVENASTALQTYLKFKQKPVKVNIINHGKGWVIYSLVTPYIAPSRHFVLLYKTDLLGRINYMRQEEAQDFFDYSEDMGDNK